MRRSALLLIVPSLLFALPAFAASGDTMTGSGSLAPELTESNSLKKERQSRADQLKKDLIGWPKLDAQYREKLATFYKKRAAFRKQCREDMRRANRDTLITTLLRCYKSVLTLERDFLKERHLYLEKLPGVTAKVRPTTLSRLDLLSDAMGTIVFAIDNGVYGVQDEVLEAKTSLLQKYRQPFWQGLTFADADRSLSQIATLIIAADAARTEEKTVTGSERPEWLTGRRCLTAEEEKLQDLVASPPADAKMSLTASLDAVQTCVMQLKAMENVTGSGAIQ